MDVNHRGCSFCCILGVTRWPFPTMAVMFAVDPYQQLFGFAGGSSDVGLPTPRPAQRPFVDPGQLQRYTPDEVVDIAVWAAAPPDGEDEDKGDGEDEGGS